MRKIRKIPIIIFAVILLLSSLAAVLPEAKDQPKFKNLKVLPKNISEEKLDSIMDNFNYSLGVNCIYCHVRADKGDELNFVSDGKSEKDIARNMMRMTDNINKKYFRFNNDKAALRAVNCMTCHRMNPIPITDNLPVRKEKLK